MKPRSTHLPLLQSLVDFLCFFLGFRFATPQAIIRPRLRRSRASALGLGTTEYHHVDDIKKGLQLLLDAGAHLLQEVKDVGGRKLIAIVKDADGNIIGLLQSPKENRGS
jgi:hypothetical protein